MKQLRLILFAIGLLGFTTACNNNESKGTEDINDLDNTVQEEDVEVNNNNIEDDDLSANQTDDDEMRSQLDKLGYYEISVEVQYADNKEYEFKIDQDRNEPIEVEIEDDLSNEYLRGKAAFDKLYPNLEKLALTSGSTEQEIIDSILSVFNLPTDYIKFEVEIDFIDGKRIDFEHRQ